ncbi:hypothetical protein [uncultured Thiodictyon sp.]|uniref:hypothetical protein n=1 Tax=uncultured Thiodictyon sp. TaxID=1846217 RepID=UPI0025D4B615|nr:hypothetical protein [uncultured Thiodictyon sp.]
MRLTQQQLEAHLWGAANILRGKTAGRDYKKVPDLVARQRLRIREQIATREHDQIERLEAGYADHAARLARLHTEAAEARAALVKITAKVPKDKAEAALAKLEAQRNKAATTMGERDEKIAETRRRAEDDRLTGTVRVTDCGHSR